MSFHPLVEKYLANYPAELLLQVQGLIDGDRLASMLLTRYPEVHAMPTDQALRDYVQDYKNRSMRKSGPLSKVVYDPKIQLLKNALGTHSYVSRVQGGKLKAKNEIRISTLFKKTPQAFLDMIVVHELAHLKEKDHNKAFYRLCQHMLPDYHQLEFDVRLYLLQIELGGALY